MELSPDRMLGIFGAFGIVIGVGVAIAMDPKVKGEMLFATGCFVFSGVALCLTVGMWAFSTSHSPANRLLIASSLFALICTSMVEASRWANSRYQRTVTVERTTNPSPYPIAPPQAPVKSPPKSAPHKLREREPAALPLGDLLTDTQKQNITDILKEREKEKADVRLVCIGEPPRYADQIQEAFKAAHWPIQRLDIGFASFSGTGPISEPLYILTPKADSPTVRAVVDALGYGRVAAPVHLDMPTIGPDSLGVPAVTIVVQKK